ncbi:MAG: threonine--tRNA ligase [Fidelibacterota bacterium]|nr:MAG: threonine--tRNA ligase [Candidatus Neomarinimicrobiota bacterium]
MSEIHITLPDGSVQTVNPGTTPAEIALSIGQRLHDDAIAALVNHELVDLQYPLENDASVEIVTRQDTRSHEVLLHSTAHLMAHAIKNLYPEVKIAIGPAIEERFYYDIDLDRPVTEDMLAEIEEEMGRIAASNYSVKRLELSKQEAMELFKERGEDYKLEILDQVDKEEIISAYQQNSFIDLCRGPHVPSTGSIKHYKLLTASGAYWRGDERNKMLQRIYGTSWADKQGLEDYLHRQEEARRRDHRKLGQELDLFSFHPVAPASPFFHQKGAIIYVELVDFIRSLNRKYNFQEVITPQIFNVELWKKSGHWEHYRENLFLIPHGEGEDEWMGVKPMNCPGHALIYASQLRSYRELPVRLADFGRLHRYEKAGVVSGLNRVRSFAIDDAHIFCTPDQIGPEIRNLFTFVQEVYDTFGFEDVEVLLSTRPEKFMGDPDLWDKAEAILAESLKGAGIAYQVDPGEGAFYGPKIDFNFRDALKRKWQLTTIQLDFSLPDRFELKYIDAHSTEQRPVIIHRAILGSVERFIGVYLEHTGGDLPLWLSPIQAIVLPVSEKARDYAQKVEDTLKSSGLRGAVDARDEKIGAKIRQAELQKIPVMLIVGEREAESNTVSLRRRHLGDLGSQPLDEVIVRLDREVKNKERSTAHNQG